MRSCFLALGAMLLASLPQVVRAGKLDDKMTTYYLTEGASPSGLALTQSPALSKAGSPPGH